MIVSFCEKRFIDDIIAGNKLFTMRKTNRFRVGMQLQLWYQNPRNVTLNPYQFATGIVSHIDEVEINFETNQVLVTPIESYECCCMQTYPVKDLDYFARLDGFSSFSELKTFFRKREVPRYRIWFDDVKPIKIKQNDCNYKRCLNTQGTIQQYKPKIRRVDSNTEKSRTIIN